MTPAIAGSCHEPSEASWHLGGFSFTGYTYRPDVYRSPVPVAASFSVAGRTLFAVRGAAVVRADVGLAGELGAWTATAMLPGPQIDVHWGDGHLEGAAYAVVDAHVVVTGPRRVYFAGLTARVCDG